MNHSSQIAENRPYFCAAPAGELYPWLSQDAVCDVAVVGGGIAGAMCAYKFAKAGIPTALVSASPIGYCSTSFAEGTVTALPPGGIRRMLTSSGPDTTLSVLGMMRSAVNITENLLLETGCSEFHRRDVLVTGQPFDRLAKDYLFLRHTGWQPKLLDAAACRERYSFPMEEALLLPKEGLECNPCELTRSLARAAKEQGAQIYENTTVTGFEKRDGRIELSTEYHHTLRARRVILAAGVPSAKDACRPAVSTVYHLVTRPVETIPGWEGKALIFAGRVRLRTTPDNRLMISGLAVPKALHNGKMAASKYRQLERMLVGMFPGIRGLSPAYRYSSTSMQLPGGMPVIGEDPLTSLYYAVCPSENGITFSVLAADLLLGHYLGRTSGEFWRFTGPLEKQGKEQEEQSVRYEM